jgi:hypothetical protein
MKNTLAFFLICMGLQVFAQDIADPQVVEGLNIAEERSKLEMLRKSQAADYSAAKKACYQKLAVTTCLEKARQVKNKQDNEIKRLSFVLNDADRIRWLSVSGFLSELAEAAPDAFLRAVENGKFLNWEAVGHDGERVFVNLEMGDGGSRKREPEPAQSYDDPGEAF